MQGLALGVVGLWVVLQSTFGPLATKLGLIAGVASSPPPTAQHYSGPPLGSVALGPNVPYAQPYSGPPLGAASQGPNVSPTLGQAA